MGFFGTDVQQDINNQYSYQSDYYSSENYQTTENKYFADNRTMVFAPTDVFESPTIPTGEEVSQNIAALRELQVDEEKRSVDMLDKDVPASQPINVKTNIDSSRIIEKTPIVEIGLIASVVIIAGLIFLGKVA